MMRISDRHVRFFDPIGARTRYLWLAAGALALTGVSCAPAGKRAMAPMAEAMMEPGADMMADDGGDGDGDGDGREAQGQRVAMVARDVRADIPRARNKDQDGEWAAVREFPVPDYSAGPEAGPRRDFRETVYWAPSIKTDASGAAKVSFYLSDAITSFRATAEGLGQNGAPARGEALISSRLPISLAAKLPLEVSYGDTVSVR